MGCALSKGSELARRSILRSGARASSSPADEQTSECGRDAFAAYDALEQADELEFIDRQQREHKMEQLLFQRFPTRGNSMPSPRDAYAYWASVVKEMPLERRGFVLQPPYTLKKAHALYAYLRRPDAEPLPRRCVYEILIAGCRLFEEQAAASGSLIHVAPPESKADRLLVCGDTHGQLQDVMVIFEEHGLPAHGNTYLFNGDIADRGRNATEIFVLLLAFKLACPSLVHINRGNHEQRDLNERPFANGGGFAWEVRAKYPHDERLIDLFQHFFMQLPIASLVGEWALVIHGGLFREPGVTLEEIRRVDACRQPPSVLETREDTLLFDALWADPHDGDGIVASDNRGGVSIQFGREVTRAFCERNGVQSVIRSHQLPKRKRGYEIQHDAMLLTIFSASNYGGVCGNRGGVLVFDEKGPAEVKEFYAPPLDAYREICELRLLDSCRSKIDRWLADAGLGPAGRTQRQQQRAREHELRSSSSAPVGASPSLWDTLVLKYDGFGVAELHVRALPKPVSSAAPTPTRYAPDGTVSPLDIGITGLPPHVKGLESKEEVTMLAMPAAKDDSIADELVGTRPSPRSKPATRRDSSGLFRLNRLPSRGRNWPYFSSGLGSEGRPTPRAPLTARPVRSDELGSLRSALQRAHTQTDLGAKGGTTRLKRHSLVSVPLRPSLAESAHSGVGSCRPSTLLSDDEQGSRAAFLPGDHHRVDRVVYYEEEDMLHKVDEDILSAMQMTICRSKANLTAAFDAAERRCSKAAREAANGSNCDGGVDAQRQRHVLPYDVWESVLCSTFPEYETLWPYYGPRLLATAADVASASVRHGPVHYMLWLDRFQVRLAYGRFKDFERCIMQRLFSALLAKTKDMSMGDLLSYLDPRTDGTLRQKEVQAALAGFDLGLTIRQLRQLVYDIGFTDPHQGVEPIEVLQALLFAVSPAVERASRSSAADSEPSRRSGRDTSPHGSGSAAAGDVGFDDGVCSGDRLQVTGQAEADLDNFTGQQELLALRAAMHSHAYKEMCALSGNDILDIFVRADADSDGFLSYEEAKDAILDLQRTCGMTRSSPHRLAALVSHIDLTMNGRITLLEFVAAFGLPALNDGNVAFPRRQSDSSLREKSGAAVKDIRSNFSLKVMQGILTALYERTPALQKAFRHLDESGTGWIDERDFEQALELILTHRRLGGVRDGEVPDRDQLHELVLSLRGSNLTDEHGRIDYCAFIQSFNVVDTLNAI